LVEYCDKMIIIARRIEAQETGQRAKIIRQEIDFRTERPTKCESRIKPLGLDHNAMDNIGSWFERVRRHLQDYGFMDKADLGGFLDVVRKHTVSVKENRRVIRDTRPEDECVDLLLPNEERCLYER